MISKKFFKHIAIVLLVAFTVTFALPTQQIAYAKSLDKQSQQIYSAQLSSHKKTFKSPVSETRLGSFADELYDIYEKLESDLENGDLKEFKSSLKEIKKMLKEIRKDISLELSENEKALKKLNAKNASDKHSKFKNEFNSKLDDFEEIFEKLDEITSLHKDLNGKDSAELRKKLEVIKALLKPEQSYQPLGNLPHDIINVDPPTPVTMESTLGIMESTGELPESPSVEDLAETEEVKFTDQIKSLADNLDTPVKIYEYVKNNIEFEPYYGSRKGAEGTLQQVSGNDIDQASLLISMLRYKGIPAHYVKGTVDIPIEKVMAWTGTKNPEAAVKTLGSLGKPTISLVSGGQITHVRTEHVWVEAYIAYENYRGIGPGTGYKIWVPLDPSFKQYETVDGLDINDLLGLSDNDIWQVLEERTLRSQEDDSILRVDVGGLSNIFDNAETELEKYLIDNNLDNGSITDVFGGKKIKPEKFGLLPLTLPYKITTVLSEFREVPKDLSETIDFSIRGSSPFMPNFSGSEDFRYEARTVDLYGKRVTLLWVPATDEDEAIINNYGGIFKVPAYLVSMKPQLKIDNVVVAEGKPVGLGYIQEFKITLKGVGVPEETIENTVIVGGMYNVGLNYGSVSADEIKKIQQNIEELRKTISVHNIYTDNAMGEILNAVAKAYFAQIDLYDDILTGQYKVSSNKLLSEAITGYKPQVKYTFMYPVEINEGSMYIDVDRNVSSVISIDGTYSSEKEYMLASGVFSSAMEHRIFEQMTGIPSVSTIKIFEEANERGVPLYNIDKQNIAEILPKLDIAESIKTDITNSVNAGRIVTIPQRNIQYFDWSGVGYLVLDPETGAAGYMISGGVAGGAMSVDEVLERYAEYVIAGLIVMVLNEIFEMLLFALLPGGWAVGLIWGIRFVAISFAIYNMIQLYQMYQITGDAVFLQEMLIQISAICTLGLIRMGPMKDFFAETGALKGLITEMKAQGIPPSTALNFLKTYGVGRAQQATQTAGFFKKYGLSDNQLLNLSQSFDRSTIMAIENAYVKSLIKFSPGDTDVILLLFKQVGNSGVASNLSDGIITLSNFGILPSVYSNYGIIGINGVASAVIAISRGITAPIIKQLADYGIKPTDYDRYQITTAERAETVAEAIAEVEKFAPLLKTERSTAFFWSGRTNGIGGAERAIEIAIGKGGTTLENLIEINNINMPEWNINDPKSIEMWRQASVKYAEQASGEVWAVVGKDVRQDSVWLQYELPTLKSNTNVTKIIIIDPETLVETIFFER